MGIAHYKLTIWVAPTGATPTAGAPTPWLCATSTPSPTATFTPTPTSTNTPTPTATSSIGPRDHGSGTCWRSGGSWPFYNVYYYYHNTLPDLYKPSIDASAQTWNDVSPSNFSLTKWFLSTQLVRFEVPLDDPDYVAGTIADPSAGPFNYAVTRLNPYKTWDTNIPPAGNAHSVQAVMTHEFGHWLYLDDINRQNEPGCMHVTMDEVINPGDYGEITLAGEDENGINWQYP